MLYKKKKTTMKIVKHVKSYHVSTFYVKIWSYISKNTSTHARTHTQAEFTIYINCKKNFTKQLNKDNINLLNKYYVQ